METKKKEIRSVIMFDVTKNGTDTTFMIFVTDSFTDYDIVQNTIISIAEMMGSNYIRIIIDNAVNFLYYPVNEQHVTIDQKVANIVFEQISKNTTEIWI